MALEGREHKTAHPALILGQTQLIGGSPQQDTEDNALFEHLATHKVLHEQHRGIARNARAVEIEHRKARRALARGLCGSCKGHLFGRLLGDLGHATRFFPGDMRHPRG